MINCPYCGTKLLKTNWGNLFCPNCGKIEEEPEEENEKQRDYIG